MPNSAYIYLGHARSVNGRGITYSSGPRVRREPHSASKPAIAAGARGASMQPYGVYTHTAIHALNALVGSIAVPSGALVQKGPPLTKNPDTVQDDVAKAGVEPRSLGGEAYMRVITIGGKGRLAPPSWLLRIAARLAPPSRPPAQGWPSA